MKAIKLFFFLVLLSTIYSQISEIESGQLVEIIFGDESKKTFTYNFTVPESETYEEGILIYKLDFDNTMYFSIKEDGKDTSGYSYKTFSSYRLSSVENKTITFTISQIYSKHGIFAIFDLSKEIDTNLDNLINIIPNTYIQFLFDPIWKIIYNIEEVDSDQTYFLRDNINFLPHTIIGNGYVEYCKDENCLNNTYTSSKVIEFKKGSKYKIKLNLIKIDYYDYYEFMGFDTIKYSEPIKLNLGVKEYNIDKNNLFNFYIVDALDMDSFRLYSKSYSYIRYAPTTEDSISNLPLSLGEMQFKEYTLYNQVVFDIKSDNYYVIIILKDDELYNKNIIYLFSKLVESTTSFKTFTLNKRTHYILRYDFSSTKFFTSIESNKPSLKKIEKIDDEASALIINQKIVCAYSEDEAVIKMRYFSFGNDKVYSNITSTNGYKFNKYLEEFGNSESLFLRWSSNNLNYYGFFTFLVYDLTSEYYLYFKENFGNLNMYNTQIDDYSDLKKFFGIIRSYEENDDFSLINGHLIVISGSQLFSSFLNYGFLGDIYIQKVNDDQNIKLNNNDRTGNLVKLLISEKMYKLDFKLNHLIKLDNDFSDAIVQFYDDNDVEIGFLDKDNRLIELNGENIKIKSIKNALIYFYSAMTNEKKLYEIIFDKEQIGKNMNITITNLNSDNESIFLIKDYGFENHYPMLSPNEWDKILIEINKTTSIFIEYPYNKLAENELVENETFIIYIANAYDENGRPYFEEEKFEIKEINYKKNSFSKYSTFDFQVIQMDKESSVILSQSNKKAINYQITLCNYTYTDYHFIIDYSNSNIPQKDTHTYYNKTFSFNIRNNEIMSHTFYMDDYSPYSFVFYYKFGNNVQSNLLSASNGYENTIYYVKALDENLLEVKFSTYYNHYYKFYIIIALVDDNNNLSSFNNYCYLTKLLTENINQNYNLKILYHNNSRYSITTKIDISNFKADRNSTFVLNIINENLDDKKLEFNYAKEFIPEYPTEVEIYNSYEFALKEKNYFSLDNKDLKYKEFILQMNCYYSYNDIIINVEGPDIDLQYTKEGSVINVKVNMTKPGKIYFKFTYKDERDDNYGTFLIFPLKVEKGIIIDFNEKIYFSNYTFYTDDNEKIFIYNVSSLSEDRLVYFDSSQITQFEICDISSNNCKFAYKFYKFLANKEYFINVYSYSYSGKRTMEPYIFGVFDKENIKLFNDLGVGKSNEPTIYLVEQKYVSFFYFININSHLRFYAEKDYETDEIFDKLPSIYFYSIGREYDDFDLRYYKCEIILVFPKFNYNLKSYEKSVIGFSNEILIINTDSNQNFKISPRESIFIKIEIKSSSFDKTLKDYFNNLRIVKSLYNNIILVDPNNGYNEYSDSLILNSIDNHSNYIYIEKSEDNNIIHFSNYEPRYSYYYALDDISLKNRTNFMKKKGYNSYFKRKNSEIGNFYGVFNKMTFDLEDKVNFYFKKYYGNSNIYKINLESYNINNLFFLTKPIKTYQNEKSILNQLLSLESNKLYSGLLDYQTLYDIYIDIDNEDNLVKMQQDDNPFNNLIKLFKPNINYILDFEVNHLIKLDPNFNAEVTITDSEKTITLNKNNLTTTEIKGNNVQITTNSNAILYFYNSISSLTSKSEVYKNMFQYEIEPRNEQDLELVITLIGDSFGYIYYLIDVGFSGYTPFESQGFNVVSERCSLECTLYFQNYYDKIKTELVEGEKLFVYYYIESDNPQTLTTSQTPTYYSSLKNINNDYSFFVIPPNTEGEEEKNLLINFYNKNKLSLQVNYCPNNDGTKPILNYYRRADYSYKIEFEDSKIYSIDDWHDTMYKFKFISSNEFVFSYFFYDKYDDIIKSDKVWNSERQINLNLIINKAEIDFDTNIAKIQFTPNYIKSSTKYFIIIGHKNDTINIESFNNPCFLIKLITENSIGVKINEVMSIGDKFIDVKIDISDLIVENSENKDYIVNIVSLELKFDKKLNFYKAKIFEKPIQIHINEEINFDEKELFYELDYSKPTNISEVCLLLPEFVSSECKIIIIDPNLIESYIYLDKDFIDYFSFECSSDGGYSIIIQSLSEEESIQGSFKIVSTGIPFDLDLSKSEFFYFFISINYQPSPLIFNIDSSNLGNYSLISFYHQNTEIFIQDENSNNMTFNNQFYYFEQEKKYKINIEFLESIEDEYSTYYLQLIHIENNFEELSFGTKNYENIDYALLKINYKNTPKIIFEPSKDETLFFIAYISDSDYNIFPQKIQELEFQEITDLQTVKPNNFDYAILLIYFYENYLIETSVEFIDGREYKYIELDNIYNIEDDFIFYNLNYDFDSIKDNEILILLYNFDKEYSGEITIKSDEYNNIATINNNLKGLVYFEVPNKKIYEFNFKNLEDNSGIFKIISTGILYKMSMMESSIVFDEIITQSETSPLIFSFDLLDKDYIIKININNEDPSKIISLKMMMIFYWNLLIIIIF